MDKNISPEFPLPEYIVDFSKDPLGELIIIKETQKNNEIF